MSGKAVESKKLDIIITDTLFFLYRNILFLTNNDT